MVYSNTYIPSNSSNSNRKTFANFHVFTWAYPVGLLNKTKKMVNLFCIEKLLINFMLIKAYPCVRSVEKVYISPSIVFFLQKIGHSRPLFLYFRLFNTVDSKMFNIIFCRWRDLNRGPLELEVTALPTEPPPLPNLNSCFHSINCLVPARLLVPLPPCVTKVGHWGSFKPWHLIPTLSSF